MTHYSCPWRVFGAAFGAILILTTLADAQVLNVTPTCGLAGQTKVCITGSGWAEPQPVCRYTFALDGTTVAPDQPDGLFGPPNSSFIVPAGAAVGPHTVRVELRLNSPDNLLQAQEKPFTVVSALADPWAATTTSGADIDSNFNGDQSTVCVSPCTKIVFIQVYQQFAIKNDDSQVATNDSFWGLPAGRDADFTSDLFVLDRIFGKTIPYYHDGAGSGNNVGGNTPATTNDAPVQGSFPAGFKGIKINFETAAFCAAGDDAGRYFGKILWTFQQNQGDVSGTSTLVSTSRDQPSADFTAAVAKWVSNPAHPYTLPTPTASACE
jgi:hypothetical protein